MNLLDNPIIEIEIILLLAFMLVVVFLSMVLLIGKMIFGDDGY